jgi:hypothetical protein
MHRSCFHQFEHEGAGVSAERIYRLGITALDNGVRYGLQTMCHDRGQANATILELLCGGRARPRSKPREGRASNRAAAPANAGSPPGASLQSPRSRLKVATILVASPAAKIHVDARA